MYYTENVTYSCWDWKDVDCDYCDYMPGRWAQKKCRKYGCRVKQLGRCYTLEERCKSDWVEHEYCCDGFEEQDGKCVANIMCGTDNGGCDQLCRSDDEEGHRCECFKGYRLQGRTQCVD